MTIVSGKKWKYVMEGDVPPNCPVDMIEGAVLSSVTWTGNMMLHCKAQSVEVSDVNPEDVAQAGSRILRLN